MSTIRVRSSHTGVGGRASCPCGWAVVTTKRDAHEQAVRHNETVHAGDFNLSINFAPERSST